MRLENDEWVNHSFTRQTRRSKTQVGKIHYCQSTIADRAVSTCGKQFRYEATDGILVVVDVPTTCESCG